jgi:hypothetical protein
MRRREPRPLSHAVFRDDGCANYSDIQLGAAAAGGHTRLSQKTVGRSETRSARSQNSPKKRASIRCATPTLICNSRCRRQCRAALVALIPATRDSTKMAIQGTAFCKSWSICPARSSFWKSNSLRLCDHSVKAPLGKVARNHCDAGFNKMH